MKKKDLSGRINTRLRVEKPKGFSGFVDEGAIEILPETHYYVKKWPLDGDAPKEFIKAYFYTEDSTVRKGSRDSWIPYIAKAAEKWYPYESVAEYMINCIGQAIGLVMNDVKLVVVNGQIRFLSKYFLHKNERLIHGAEICGEHLQDVAFAKEIAEHRKSSRELFTFEFIKEAIFSVYPGCCKNIMQNLVKMIAFDALVGNNDRHFYNWGIVDTIKKTGKEPNFAPLYDSARGLFWNWTDEMIVKGYNDLCKGGKEIVNYIKRAYPRISIEKNVKANHFELIDFVKKEDKEYETTINALASHENLQRTLKMLKKEIHPLFIKERACLIEYVLEQRFEIVRRI